jgi:hypothetical protein
MFFISDWLGYVDYAGVDADVDAEEVDGVGVSLVCYRISIDVYIYI